MSEFSSKYVCENTRFYELNVDPVVANAPGVITLASGHTATPLLPDQQYTLTVDLSGHLLINGQSSNPSPMTQPIDISPNGNVAFDGNITSAGINATGDVVVHAPAPTGSLSSASLSLYTGNANNQNFTFYANNGSGGGLNDGHLQLFSYNDTSSNWVSQVFDLTPQTASAAPSLNFSAALFANGQALGPVSRQYAAQTISGPVNLPTSNGPKTVYSFDLSGFAAKKHFMVNIDSFSFNCTPGYSDPVTISLYLCDTLNGAKASNACLVYSSGELTSGPTFTMNNLSFTYTGSAAPSTLCLNAMVTTSTGPAAQLSNIAFNAAIVAP